MKYITHMLEFEDGDMLDPGDAGWKNWRVVAVLNTETRKERWRDRGDPELGLVVTDRVLCLIEVTVPPPVRMVI